MKSIIVFYNVNSSKVYFTLLRLVILVKIMWKIDKPVYEFLKHNLRNSTRIEITRKYLKKTYVKAVVTSNIRVG